MTDDKLAKLESQELAELPSFIDKGDRTGTEDITSSDLRMPRIAIAQGLSPQLLRDNSDYIEGLQMFDMFNDLTQEIYGQGPIPFVAVRREVRRIEFIPREDGGGIKDLDVPPNDARTFWTVDEVTGERVPPAATKFVEFVVLLLKKNAPFPEPIVLSIKDTNKWNRRAAERLTGFIKLPHPKYGNLPIYAKVFTLQSASERNDQGTFGVPVIKQAGLVQEENIYKFAKAFRESLEGKTIVIQREPGDESEVEAEM